MQTAALREEVIRHFTRMRGVAPRTGSVDPRLREQLRSLGYIN